MDKEKNISFAYTAAPAIKALDLLAAACIKSPHAVKAIAALKQPLFRSSLQPDAMNNYDAREFTVWLEPEAVLSQFIKTLNLIAAADDEAPLSFEPGPGNFVAVPANLQGADPVVFEAIAQIRRILQPFPKVVLEEINATSDRSIIPATAHVTARFSVRPFMPL